MSFKSLMRKPSETYDLTKLYLSGLNWLPIDRGDYMLSLGITGKPSNWLHKNNKMTSATFNCNHLDLYNLDEGFVYFILLFLQYDEKL